MIGETVTVLRQTAPAGFGESSGGRGSFTDHHTITGCAFAPTGGYELTADRDTAVTQPTLYTPPGVDVKSTDRLRIRGVVYEVDGVPAEWRSPFTGKSRGFAVPLKGVTG